MPNRFLGALLGLVLLPAIAFGQATVLQGGSQTQGHIPTYATTGGTPVVSDGGTAAGGVLGANPSQLGVTARGTGTAPFIGQGNGPNGEIVCYYDGPTNSSAGYHSLCFSANVGSKAIISTQAGGGASAQGLQFLIDGTTYNFPGDFPTIPVTVPNGGTGLTSVTAHNLLIGNGTSALTLLAPSSTTGMPLVSQGSSTDPAYGSISVGGGGTGLTDLTAHNLIIGNGTSAATLLPPGTSGLPLLSAGASSDPAYGTLGISGGGTGQTTANAALNALLPSQATHNGQFLTTDGTDTSWATVAGTGTVTSVTFQDGLTADNNPCTISCTAKLANVADGSVLANISGGATFPSATTTSDLLDATLGNTQGNIAYRNGSGWTVLAPSTNGLALVTGGAGANPSWSQVGINNLSIAGQTQGDVIYFNGSAWTRLAAGTSGQVLTTGGASADPAWSAPVTVPVQQTVLSGPVDSNGLAAFGGSTGSTTVTASGTLIATSANGFGSNGGVNNICSITNPSWTGLSTNGTTYLYLDATSSTCTTGSSANLAPTYQWGGTYSTTSGQFTFNIQEMVGKVGNGSTADQANRVYVGEVTVSGNVVTAITWYQLLGRYDSGFTATLPSASTNVSKSSNLGIKPTVGLLIIECTTTDQGYAVGDQIVNGYMGGNSANLFVQNPVWVTANTIGFSTGTVNGAITTPKGGGANVSLTAASWKYKLVANRGW